MHWVPDRRSEPELLDLPPGSCTPDEIAGNLADMALVNARLGNIRAVLKHVAALAEGFPGGGFTVLDVATGSADIPVALAQWARRKRKRVRIMAVDRNPVSIEVARRRTAAYPEITLAVADGLALPFADGSFDIVLCSKTVHHFDDVKAMRLIEGFLRVARRGYVIIDLRRNWIAYFLIRALARIFSGNRLTRHDGPLSVLRSRTPGELAALAAGSGTASFRMSRECFSLVVLAGRAA